MIMQSFREAILMSMQQAQHEGTQGVAEHRAYVAALAAGEPERARQIMAAHLDRTATAVAESDTD
jgi:GntR family transcriptional repressor for pyruvate dehydrogenase complex